MKRQLAYILARQQVSIETEDEALAEILNNTKLSENFKRFGAELNVSEPKSLEDIYKSHLENSRKLSYPQLLITERGTHPLRDAGAGSSANVDSARQNLASTFVNAFVNAGFGNDKLMVEAEEGQSWIYKNKDHGAWNWTFSFGRAVDGPHTPQECSARRLHLESVCCGTQM